MPLQKAGEEASGVGVGWQLQPLSALHGRAWRKRATLLVPPRTEHKGPARFRLSENKLGQISGRISEVALP